MDSYADTMKMEAVCSSKLLVLSVTSQKNNNDIFNTMRTSKFTYIITKMLKKMRMCPMKDSEIYTDTCKRLSCG
jgi:hypothetical protein